MYHVCICILCLYIVYCTCIVYMYIVYVPNSSLQTFISSFCICLQLSHFFVFFHFSYLFLHLCILIIYIHSSVFGYIHLFTVLFSSPP